MVEVDSTFDTASYKTMNAIGDIYERSCYDKVLLYVANKFLWFDLK